MKSIIRGVRPKVGTKETSPAPSMPSRKGLGRAIDVIDLEVFQHQIPVFISDEDRVHDLRKRGFNPIPCDRSHYGLVSMEESDEGQVMIALVITPYGDYGTIVHEASHIVDFIFEHLGILPGSESTETRAYVLGYIFEKTAEMIHENRKAYPHLYGINPPEQGAKG